MKTKVGAHDGDPYDEYRTRYKASMTAVARVMLNALKFGGRK